MRAQSGPRPTSLHRPCPRACGQVLPGVVLLVLMRVAPAAYARRRGALVFASHLVFTHTRAVVAHGMQAQAAVGWKAGRSLGAGESPLHLLCRMACVSGVLPRLVEPVGARAGARARAHTHAAGPHPGEERPGGSTPAGRSLRRGRHGTRHGGVVGQQGRRTDARGARQGGTGGSAWCRTPTPLGRPQ